MSKTLQFLRERDQNEGTATSTASNMDQTKEIYSFTNDIAPKVRKPYTIRKQREKWSDEEHQRFLEALKLYGRGWRQIEEHVGTKTAVQIRSHAQKFFSKVARGLNGNPSGSDSLIDIPPPRPKKKPVHPYPRKSLDARVISNSYQSERSPSSNCSSMEKETGSPTSVLSAICSEGQQIGSPSPTSCTTKQTCISLAAAGKVSSASKEDEFGKGCFSLTRKKLLLTTCNSKPKDSSSPDGIRGTSAFSTAIKLFGRTFMVAEVEKPPPRDTNDGRENSTVDDDNKIDEPSPSNENQDTQLSLGKICSTSIPSSSVQLSFDGPLQWWPPFIYLTPCNPPQENPCSGSNTAISTNGADTRERIVDSIDGKCENKPCKLRNGQRGFVPYKRCAAESEAKSDETVSPNERQTQRARLCA